MPTAELIAIGTELLLGEITDTNTKYLARQFRDCGIDLYRSSIVGDNLQRIALLMKEALNRADIVLTTGGLGPTVDDPTRDAAALAFDTQNEFHPELWEQIKQRFLKRSLSISDNNRKQAMIPAGAVVIPNPVGTAPSFILHRDGKTLICLPGVPREMEYLLQSAVIPWLKKEYKLSGIIKARVLHTSGLAESKVDELVGDLEELTNPTVGLLAHPGIVDIRITAKSESEEQADRMIREMETTVRQRLGDDIYGVDDETLPRVIQSLVNNIQQPVHLLVDGFSTDAFTDLEQGNLTVERKEINHWPESIAKLSETNHLIFTFQYSTSPEMASIKLSFLTSNQRETFKREFPGEAGIRDEWAKNFSLSFMRHQLISRVIPEGKND